MKSKIFSGIMIACLLCIQMSTIAWADVTVYNETITSSTTEDANVNVTNKNGIVPAADNTVIDLTENGNGNVTVNADISSDIYGIYSHTSNNLITVKDIVVDQDSTDTDHNTYGICISKSGTVIADTVTVDKASNGLVCGIYTEANTAENSITLSTKDIRVIGVAPLGIFENATKGSLTTYVDGNITSNDCGIYLNHNNDASDFNTTIICSGTISGKKAIVMQNPITSTRGEFTIYQLTGEDSNSYLTILNNDADNSKTESILKSMNYIIKTGANDSAINFTGTTAKNYTVNTESLTFNTALEGAQIQVTVANGYDLKAGNGIIVSDDGNGNYIVEVPRGGGVTLEAILKAVEEAHKNNSSGSRSAWTSTPTTVGTTEAPISNGTWNNKDGIMTYTVNGESLKNTVACISYTDKSGKVIIGFYYFDKSGRMQTEWQKIGDKYYYFDKTTGMMLMNTQTPDGYKVGADGAWIQ